MQINCENIKCRTLAHSHELPIGINSYGRMMLGMMFGMVSNSMIDIINN